MSTLDHNFGHYSDGGDIMVMTMIIVVLAIDGGYCIDDDIGNSVDKW